MVHSEKHTTLNAEGVGACGVPMWCNGMPAGFCEAPAYGPQEKDQQRYGNFDWNQRRWFPGYSSGLACYGHGGPQAPALEVDANG